MTEIPLWMVITVFGHVGWSVGPLPYDMIECQIRADAMQQGIHAKFITPDFKIPNIEGDDRAIHEDDVLVACLFFPFRPPSSLDMSPNLPNAKE